MVVVLVGLVGFMFGVLAYWLGCLGGLVGCFACGCDGVWGFVNSVVAFGIIFACVYMCVWYAICLLAWFVFIAMMRMRLCCVFILFVLCSTWCLGVCCFGRFGLLW